MLHKDNCKTRFKLWDFGVPYISDLTVYPTRWWLSLRKYHPISTRDHGKPCKNRCNLWSHTCYNWFESWQVIHPLTRVYRMMTSSNGNIFRVTGPLCGEFTGPGEFPTQRPVTRSFDVFFDLRLNKRLSTQPRGWWFETPSWSLWRHRNGTRIYRLRLVFSIIFYIDNQREKMQ